MRLTAIALGISLAFFLICDFFLGFLLIPDTIGDYHPTYHHGLRPNARGIGKWGDGYFTVYTNSLGLRDAAIRAVDKANDRYRIVFMGDSFTEGMAVPYEKSFTGLISNSLDAHRYEVLNAAVASYSPKLYYLKTRYLLEKGGLRFNELVVYIDMSDPQDEIVYQSFIPSETMRFTTRLDLFIKRHSFLYDRYYDPVNRIFLCLGDRKWRDFYRHYARERAAWSSDPAVFDKWGRTGLGLCATHMDELYALCREHGIRLVVAVYPWPQQIYSHELNSMQVLFWKTFCEERGISFLNYFPRFINHRPAETVSNDYFIKGDVHWNEKGHKVIADGFLRSGLYKQTN